LKARVLKPNILSSEIHLSYKALRKTKQITSSLTISLGSSLSNLQL